MVLMSGGINIIFLMQYILIIFMLMVHIAEDIMLILLKNMASCHYSIMILH